MRFSRNCVICGTDRSYILQGYEDYFFSKCRECKIVFSRIIPSKKSLAEHYSQYSRNNEVCDLTELVYGKWILDWKNNGFSSHLDFGCGSGELVKYANMNGINSVGTEIDESAIKILKMSGVRAENFSQILAKNNTFDVITLIEVVEHLSDPLQVLTDLNRLLTDKGMLFITTPNFDSLNRYLYQSKWRVLSYPDHINMFSKNSIIKILRTSGFDAINVRTSGLTLGDKKHTNRFSKQVRLMEVSNQRNFFSRNRVTRFVKAIANLILNFTNFGDTIKVSAYKFKS